MLFNSWQYLVFFLLVSALYFVLSLRYQNVLLLVASYFFYSWWDWRFTFLLLLSTVVDYTVGRKMEAAAEPRRKWLLAASLATNLGILGFFKYFNFFVESFAEVLSRLGVQHDPYTLGIVLPVGISFYTFQTLAYTIDVYRRRIPAERDPVVFGVYVAFFPQLVAGPIERAGHLLPQLRAKRRISQDQLASGCLLILLGLFRKVAIADVAAARVDEVFSAPASMSSASLLAGAVLFGLQIYCDFAGYSEIARGCARVLGIELMQNFNQPYFATNITEFWRRWHISLSTWLRDYLYLPLGGSRGPRWFWYRNLLLTMLLGGLWHGAAWTFVAWGGLQGLALVVHKAWLSGRRVPERAELRHPAAVARAFGGWAVTVAFVTAAWVLFRAPDFPAAIDFLGGICAAQGGLQGASLTLVARLMMLTLAIDVPQYLARDLLVFLRWPWPVRGGAYATLVLYLVLSGSREHVPFLYFQF